MFEIIMDELGLDRTNDSLKETPMRVAKMYVDELFWGLDYDNFPRIMAVDNSMKYDSLVLERKIRVTSVCEHHWVPIIGKAHIAYVPNGKVLGLSKLNRLVDFFSRRPQVQERLSEQIFRTLQLLIDSENVAINIEAEHLCVKCRGIEDADSDTVTTRLGGEFKKAAVRAEFYHALKL